MDNSNSRHTGNINPHQPSNYMSYALGGSYDENQYLQYAPGDYNMNPQPPVERPPMRQPSAEQVNAGRFPPKTFTDTNGGRAPDTQSAIRPPASRDWRVGSSFPEQPLSNQPRFQPEQKDSHRSAFEVVGDSGKPSPMPSNQNNVPIRTSYYSCPACGELAVKVSDNISRDASCRNGHRWQLVQSRE